MAMDGQTDIQTGHMDVTETLAEWIEFNMIIKRSEDSPIVFFCCEIFSCRSDTDSQSSIHPSPVLGVFIIISSLVFARIDGIINSVWLSFCILRQIN